MLGRTNAGGGGGVGGVLTVTAPAGVSVSVSKDGKTKRKTVNAEGLAIFKGLATGTWTLTITDGVQTSTKPVVITADYSTTIAFFAATINITYPSGSTCTCTDGATTLKAPDTSGTWACIVPNAGKWAVTCTDGSETTTQSVSIATSGQVVSLELSYRLYLYKPGMTVSLASMGWTPISGQIAEAPTIKYNSDHVVVKLETSIGGRCGIGYFSNVDLSKFSNLHISLNLSGHIDSNYNVNCIRIWNNAGSEVARKTLASGNAEIDIPVESLDGKYNIGIGLRRGNNNIYCKIFEAYLV